MTSRDRRQQPRDRGAATVLALALCAVMLSIASAVLALAQLAGARQRVSTAADLAALAGAARSLEGVDVACLRAGDIAAANEARIDECRLLDGDLLVRLSVPAPPLVAAAAAAVRRDAARVVAAARAGPDTVAGP